MAKDCNLAIMSSKLSLFDKGKFLLLAIQACAICFEAKYCVLPSPHTFLAFCKFFRIYGGLLGLEEKAFEEGTCTI